MAKVRKSREVWEYGSMGGKDLKYESPEFNSGLCMFPYPKTNECNYNKYFKKSAKKIRFCFTLIDRLNVEFVSQFTLFVDLVTSMFIEHYISIYRLPRCQYPVNKDKAQQRLQNSGCRYKNYVSYDSKSPRKNHLPDKGLYGNSRHSCLPGTRLRLQALRFLP